MLIGQDYENAWSGLAKTLTYIDVRHDGSQCGEIFSPTNQRCQPQLLPLQKPLQKSWSMEPPSRGQPDFWGVGGFDFPEIGSQVNPRFS